MSLDWPGGPSGDLAALHRVLGRLALVSLEWRLAS